MEFIEAVAVVIGFFGFAWAFATVAENPELIFKTLYFLVAAPFFFAKEGVNWVKEKLG